MFFKCEFLIQDHQTDIAFMISYDFLSYERKSFMLTYFRCDENKSQHP